MIYISLTLLTAANLGIVQSDLGKYDEAIKSFEQSMMLSPQLAEAPKCLGDTYKHVHRWVRISTDTLRPGVSL
jgi:hypothetical protein